MYQNVFGAGWHCLGSARRKSTAALERSRRPPGGAIIVSSPVGRARSKAESVLGYASIIHDHGIRTGHDGRALLDEPLRLDAVETGR